MDKVNKETLIAIMENQYIKNNEYRTKIYLQKQIYGYVFVYDVTEKATLDYLKKYIEHIEENEEKKKNGGLTTKKVLVGNKFDQIAEKEKEKMNNNKPKEIKELMDKFDMTHYYCSALENFNVEQIFEDLVRRIMGDIKIEVIENDFAEATQDLHPKKPKPEKGKRKKRNNQQQNWSDNILAGLGCGNANDEESSDEGEADSNNGDEADANTIPKFEKSQEKSCHIY